MPARLRPGEETDRITVRLPVSFINWLELEGGGDRGAVSTQIRRLIKEELWRREGKFVEMRRDEYEDLIRDMKRRKQLGRPTTEAVEIREVADAVRARFKRRKRAKR